MKRYISIILLVFLSACSSKVNMDRPSSEFIEEGNAFYDRGNFRKAAQSFENALLNSDSPADAQLSQRMIGNAHFRNKNFVEAIAAYEVYYTFYFDDDETIPLVLYRLGLAYASLSFHPRRDQTFTAMSVNYLDQLKAMFPNDFDELGAQTTLTEMLNKLAEAEYRVGRFYFRLRHNESAFRRFTYLTEHYPESPRYKEANDFLREIKRRTDAGH